ncbi:MAG: bile acid:sodium symporter family protein [Pirellulales bacterium]|nr:bile acid:sodium symporter family protein [Pirellulales bacterium]
MLKLFVHHWFLWALLVILVSGLAWPGELERWSNQIPHRPIVAMVLFLMALPLELQAIGRVLKRPLPGLLAIGLNIGLAPVLAWFISWQLPHGLSEGLLIASAAPCTLASAAVWTRRAGGNDAIALLVMIVTNLACFLVTPAWIFLFLGTQVTISFGTMVLELAWLVGFPIILAQILRGLRPVATWATGQKIALGTLAQVGILSIVFVGAVKSGDQLRQIHDHVITLGHWAMMVIGVFSVHLSVLVIGWIAARALRISRPDSMAVAFAGSQKTLMVGLSVAIQCAPMFGGLVVLPMVAYHVGQLVVDTLVADFWRKRTSRRDMDAT